MTKRILFFDELKSVSPEHKAQITEFLLQRPSSGKSRVVAKITKKLNKQRKRAGLEKIKTKKIKLAKVPKNWLVFTNPKY